MALGRVHPREQGTPAQHPAFLLGSPGCSQGPQRLRESAGSSRGARNTLLQKKRKTDRHKKEKRKRLLRLRAGYLYT